MQFRFHLISLPHTRTNQDYEWCAYTSKVRKFSNMMVDRGHEIYLYSGSYNKARCTEHINCAKRLSLPANGIIPEFNPENSLFKKFNRQAIKAITERIQPQDFILLIGGRAQQDIFDAFPDHMSVEFGIGYSGVIPGAKHIWESYAWMHSVLGSFANDAHSLNGNFFDAVIPNYFDINDFPMGDHKGDYLLYVGRLIERKGVQIAIETAEKAHLPLHVAGAGDYSLPNWVEYHGVVGPQERAKLMGNAKALIAPTIYVEPFGGVVVEAQLCGTPVITTDWGAFTETVEQGFTGYRCHTQAEFTAAALGTERFKSLHEYIRNRAISLYSTETVALKYERHFERLMTLWDRGYYDENIRGVLKDITG